MPHGAFVQAIRRVTPRRMLRVAMLAAFAGAAALTARAQTFSAAPIVFAPTGDNFVQGLRVGITLTAASTIRSISIPIPLAAQPEFTLDDAGGCVKDGATVNAAGTVCYVNVRFHARVAGRRTATLLITDGSGNSAAIPITGTGFFPQISVVPAAAKIAAGLGPAALAGDGDAAILSSLHAPQGIAADSFGNIYIADTGNNVVRMLDAFGNITTIAGGGASAGAAADGGAATAASLAQPTWLAADAAGNLFIAESGSHVIRRVAMSTTRTISTVAGSYAADFSGDGGLATAARLNNPQGIAVDATGNLYIADSGNRRIRLVDAASGNISTLAGSGESGFNASATPALSSQFSTLSALALDLAGNLYIADTGNHTVRELSGGSVSVVAGTGVAGTTGDGAAATAAKLVAPSGLALSAAGDLYISDAFSNAVRKVQALDGIIETVAGVAGKTGFTTGVRPSTSVEMSSPLGIAFDPRFNLYIADSNNNVIRQLSPSPAELSFAAQAVGNTSSPAPFRIANIGNAPLTLVNVAAANDTTTSNFTLAQSSTQPCADTVAAGAHCTYTVAYAPAATGAVTGEFDITYKGSTDHFNSTAPVIVTGGLLTAIAINPAALASILQGQPASQSITVTGGIGAVTVDLEGTLPAGMASSISGGTITLSGTPTQSGAFALTVFATDSLGATVTQTYTLQILPLTLTLHVIESMTLSDTVRPLPGLQLTVTESLHMTDTITPLPGLQLSITETMHVADNVTPLLPLMLNFDEVVHVTDALTETPSLTLAVTEVLHVTDSLVHAPSVLLSVSEIVHVADAATEARSVVLAISEVVHVADADAPLPSTSLAITETVHVADSDIGLPSLPLAIDEVVHVTDGTSSVRGVTLAVTETITVSDADSASLAKLSQTITAPVVPSHTYGDGNFSASATASSNLPVAISVSSGPATINGNSVSLNGAGTVTLTFTQAGNSSYDSAPSIQRSFTVAPASATVTANSASRAFETANPAFTFTLTGLVHGDSASALSGTPVLSTTAMLNSPAGTYPISVAQGTLSSPNYAFVFVPGSLTVLGNVAQMITFATIPNLPLGTGPLTLTAHSTSGLAVTYTVTGPAVISKNKLVLTGAGAVSVTASQAGNTTFNAAPFVTRTFQVTP